MKSGLNGIDGADSWCPNTPGIKGGNGDTMVCYVNSKLLFTNIGGYGGTGGFNIYNRDPSPGTPGGDGDINFFLMLFQVEVLKLKLVLVILLMDYTILKFQIV